MALFAAPFVGAVMPTMGDENHWHSGVSSYSYEVTKLSYSFLSAREPVEIFDPSKEIKPNFLFADLLNFLCGYESIWRDVRPRGIG